MKSVDAPLTITHFSAAFDFYSELKKEHSQSSFGESSTLVLPSGKGRRLRKTNKKRYYFKEHQKKIVAENCEILKKIFLNDFEISTILQLCSKDQHLFIEEIFKKKFPHINSQLSFPEKLEVFRTTSFKRSEEMFKYVFKKVIRRMTKERIEGRPVKKTEKSLRSLAHTRNLFQQYFQKEADRRGEPLEAFMIPKSVKHPQNLKTFNKYYFNRLGSSKEFLLLLLKEIDHQTSMVEVEVKKKLIKFFKHVESRFMDRQNVTGLMRFVQSSGCKLPWTLAEAAKSFSFVKSRLVRLM